MVPAPIRVILRSGSPSMIKSCDCSTQYGRVFLRRCWVQGCSDSAVESWERVFSSQVQDYPKMLETVAVKGEGLVVFDVILIKELDRSEVKLK